MAIDEGDFVKSDGKYFYVTHLFLGEKKLAAITDLGETHLVRIYNMTDIENPVLFRKLEISDNKINTRQIGSIIYVISRETVKSADKLP